MPKVEYARQFKKDLLRLKHSGWNMEPFNVFSHHITKKWPLPTRYEAHELLGDKGGVWDIHVRQNWIVLLKKEGDMITLLRTGTHASLGIG